MKRFQSLAAALLVLSAPLAVEAVVMRMTNASGGGSMELFPGLSNDLQIRIETSSIDTVPVSFVITFLNAGGGNVATEVTGVTPGAPDSWTFDRSAFELPAELSEDQGNEYGLVSGDPLGTNAYPLGNGVYIHDVLTLTQTSASTDVIQVTFETGARNPLLFGPPPDYTPFSVGGCDFPPCTNRLFIGDEAGNNTPFLIYQGIPEPSAVLGLAVGSILVFRRKQRASV